MNKYAVLCILFVQSTLAMQLDTFKQGQNAGKRTSGPKPESKALQLPTQPKPMKRPSPGKSPRDKSPDFSPNPLQFEFSPSAFSDALPGTTYLALGGLAERRNSSSLSFNQ